MPALSSKGRAKTIALPYVHELLKRLLGSARLHTFTKPQRPQGNVPEEPPAGKQTSGDTGEAGMVGIPGKGNHV